MLHFDPLCLIFLWVLIFQNPNIQTLSYIRHLSLPTNINHLTYSSSSNWLYIASINTLSIYDENLTLIQNISIDESKKRSKVDPCQINPCQCLLNTTTNDDYSTTSDRNRRSKRISTSSSSSSIDTNNYNLVLYLEKEHRVDNQPYLIDCWSLQTGSCILRNALNLSDIYYQQRIHEDQKKTSKFLFNTDPTIPNHIFPFHLKLNKCNNTPSYLFLTSTLRKNILVSDNRDKIDNGTDSLDSQCLEHAQRRTIALRAFISDKIGKRSMMDRNSAHATANTLKNRNVNATEEEHFMMKMQPLKTIDSMNMTRSSSNHNQSNLRSSATLFQSNSIFSMGSDDDYPSNEHQLINETSSSMTSFDGQGPFININDYCPEQLSVLRSIYTDFFEGESSDKFRLFQDIIYDPFDAAIYVFTNQQYISKIVRLCEGQISFRHYVELPIHCGNDYTLIQKVKLIPWKNQKYYLLVIASKPISSHSLDPSIHSHSAICLYDFDHIRNAFVDSVLLLSKGNVSLGMAWLHGDSVILPYPAPYANLARCSTTRDASYLMIYEGSSNIVSRPLMTFPSDQLTSLDATVVSHYIVAFVGTSEGKIKKISIQPTKKKALEFDQVFVHFGESILRDMTLDTESHYLYGATKSRIFQLDLHDCDQHKTCFTCLATQNPYCSWQTTSNRCAVRTNATDDKRRFSWLQIRDSCPNILEIKPNTISKARSSKLHLRVNSVPDDPSSKYFCSFGFTSLLTETDENDHEIGLFMSNATKHDNSIECDSPPGTLLSTIDLSSIMLHLYYNEIILAEKNLTFYDCSSYMTCTLCLHDGFNCIWHLLTSQCMDRELKWPTNETTTDDAFIDQIDDQCPRFNTSVTEVFIADGDTLILGDGAPVQISTVGLKLNVQQYFRCQIIRSNGFILSRDAKINNQSVICNPFHISYEKEIGQESSTFSIEWTECLSGCTYKRFEAISNLTITTYKCKHLADSCGACILLREDYRCLWCETDKSCRHEFNSSICPSHQIISPSMGICPDPRIQYIHPQTGPQYGRTPIRIFGSSLGKRPEDVSVVLIHSNQSEYGCEVLLESYLTAQSFLCRPPSLEIGVYAVKISVHSVISRDRPIFRVAKPMIHEIHPNVGPRSGGTLISIHGKHLHVGSKIKVFVGDQECHLLESGMNSISTKSNSENGVNPSIVSSVAEIESIVEPEEEIIQCRTSKLAVHSDQNVSNMPRLVKREALWNGSITILIDNYTETYRNVSYVYTEDPEIYDLSRYAGIQSGGLPFLVRGINFDSIQTPQFFLQHNDNHSQILIENCSVKTSTMMLCFGPAFPWLSSERFINSTVDHSFSTSTTPSSVTHVVNTRSNHQKFHCAEFKFGFYMDDVERVRNTSNYHEAFVLCPDPIIYPFDNDGKRIQYRYDYLTIEGSNLLDVATVHDYFITIGSYPCNITSISDKQIVCQPTNLTIEKLSRRKRLLLDLNSRDQDQPIVRITLGRRIYTLGTLTYTSNIEKRSLVLYYIIASICGFLLTVFIIIVSIIFRRINSKRTRQLHRLQNQIDTLEMRVARECKEAFAELQTDIGEIANDLSHSGVPYHDYRTFCMKVLFPNAKDEERYMMLNNIDIPLETNRRKSVRQGLQLLSQCLYNRHFLLLIIRTLEADKIKFRLQDRMQFASLISILLQENIDYFTDMLKLLLKELIDKSIQQDRNNSKILLRSNASVAEKMLSNWFAFLLFGYIKDRLGSPLYILFQSIKQQIQKGPIDFMTSESRYSLSEDKLLRQQVDYQSMIVYVIQVEEEKALHLSTPVPIKVLSCDSITQVKEKIVDHFYKTIPFSKRPPIESFDLEWRVGSQMKPLRDEEKVDNLDSNGFVQIQTLATYKVHDGARLFLSLKRGTNYTNNSSFSSLMSSQTNTGLLSNSFANCYTSNPSSSTKMTDTDQHWRNLQGTDNQILLHSTLDLIQNQKDNRSNQSNLSEKSNSHRRMDKNIRLYHLIKPTDREDDDRSLITNKLVSEVYLTRLLATKGSLQKYIDNFFDSIFCLTNLPSPIKYLFDFLDEQAEFYQISDSNIVHTWKSNSLPLRFFVNIIKNPDFIFDVQKTNVIDASLSVIAQMFMDSCAAGTHQLTKDSPSSKLLFYRDVQKYKKLVEKYYDAIASLPPTTTSDLNRNVLFMAELEESNPAMKRSNEFNRNYALFKLYNEFLNPYKDSLRLALTSDLHAKQYRLAALFDQIVNLMESFELDI